MAPTWQSGWTVLLIEDDRDIAVLIGEILGEEGYATTVATTIEAGIALLDRQRFDLVLSDAFADDGFGEDRWQGLEAIRRAAGTTPVIICTAHRADDFGDHAARGFAALLEKPFDLDALIALMERTLHEREEVAGPCRERGEG